MKVTKRGGGLAMPLQYLALVLASLFSLWPVLIMFLEGFGIDLSPIFSGKGIRFVGGIPFYSGGINPSPVHYLDELNLGSFPRLVMNSSTIALLSVGVALAVGLPAAYALARLKIRGKNAVAFLLLALRTVSPFAIILPLFVFYTHTGLWDTYQGASLAYLVILLPVVVWVLRGFFADISREVYEAAELFGASEKQIFWRVALPQVLPGVAAVAVFAFALVWNEFLMADILTGPFAKTVSVGVWAGSAESVGFRTLDLADLTAAGALAFIPAFSMLLLIKKYLARGFSLATAR